MSGNPGNALILFTKDPVPGQCKNRMTPELTPGEAAELYQAFIRDLITKCGNQADFALHVFCLSSGAEKEGFWGRLGIETTAQQGADMGERMRRAFLQCFDKGYSRVVLIGSDVPVMPVRRVREAFEKLHEVDIVLGPSEDGGYYLMGLTEDHGALFESMTWGTGTVFDETLAAIYRLGLKAAILEKENDMDDFQDLQRLNLHSEVIDRHPLQREAPHTYAFLKKIFNK